MRNGGHLVLGCGVCVCVFVCVCVCGGGGGGLQHQSHNCKKLAYFTVQLQNYINPIYEGALQIRWDGIYSHCHQKFLSDLQEMVDK